MMPHFKENVVFLHLSVLKYFCVYTSEKVHPYLCLIYIHMHIMVKFTTVCREDHGLARTIKESIYIRVNNITFNRSVGKYNLHHIWDRVLFNTPDLKINNDNGHTHRTSFIGHAQSIQTSKHTHSTIGHTGHALNSKHVHGIS